MAVEATAGIACEQLEQIDTPSNRFGNHFPVATITSCRRVEKPFECVGHQPDATQFNCLRDVRDHLKSTGNSSVHEEEIDGAETKLEFRVPRSRFRVPVVPGSRSTQDFANFLEQQIASEGLLEKRRAWIEHRPVG